MLSVRCINPATLIGLCWERPKQMYDESNQHKQPLGEQTSGDLQEFTGEQSESVTETHRYSLLK